MCATYILEVRVVVLADVVELVDENMVILAQKVDSFADASACECSTAILRLLIQK